MENVLNLRVYLGAIVLNVLKKIPLFALLLILPIMAMELTSEDSIDQQLHAIIESRATVKVSKQQQGKAFYPEFDADLRKKENMQRALEQYLNPEHPLSSPFAEKIKKITKLIFLTDTLSGHSGFVMSVAFSPDGKILASASSDGKIKLWDTDSRKEIAQLSGHSKAVHSVAFSPDGKRLAAAWGIDIKLWDVANKKEIATLTGHGLFVSSVAFNPDGKILASGSCDGKIKLWDTDSKKEIATLSEDDWVYSVAFSPNGKILASGLIKASIKLWDTANKEEIATLRHSLCVFSVAFSPDEKTLASGSRDHAIKLWDVDSKKEIATLSGHTAAVNSVVFNPNGKILASVSSDNTIKLWDVGSKKEIAMISGHNGFMDSIAFSPDGKILASGSSDKTAKLWDLKPITELNEFLKSLHANTTGLKKFLLLHAIFESNADKDAQGKPKKIDAPGFSDKTNTLWNMLTALSAYLKSLYANKDAQGNPKQPKPLDLYQPEAIALLKDLPKWLQKILQDKKMVRVFNKVGEKK